MPPNDPRRFLIQIDKAGPPIVGQWQPQGLPERAFVGWTELFAGLDAAISDAFFPDEAEDGSEPRPG